MSDNYTFIDKTVDYRHSEETNEYQMINDTWTLSAPDGDGFKDKTQEYLFSIC